MSHPTAYGSHYRRRVARLRASGTLCAHCQRAPATTLDHDPPIAMHRHREGSHCCVQIPSCEPCNRAGGVAVRNGWWRPSMSLAAVEVESEPERDGLGVRDKRWRVAWLDELRVPPDNATWPRLMTVPHPRAVGSLGPAFIAWAEQRSGRPLRWWQRLVATRLLEVDE